MSILAYLFDVNSGIYVAYNMGGGIYEFKIN